MAILLFAGLPGSGKSYGVVENVIIPNLRKGRQVITNIPLIMEEMLKDGIEHKYFPRYKVLDIAKALEEPDYLLKLPGGAIIVIDEVWRLWSSGQKSTQIPIEQKEFLAEHRHVTDEKGNTQEIVLVTQDVTQIAQYPKVLIKETYISTKLDNAGMENRYRIDVYAGAVSTANPRGQRIRELSGTYNKDTWKFYKSHTKSEVVGIENKADKRANVMHSKLIKVGLPMAALAIGLGVYGAVNSMGAMFGKKEKVKVTEVKHESIPSTKNFSNYKKDRLLHKEVKAKQKIQSESKEEPKVEPQKKDEPDYSKNWRIVGTIESQTKRKVLLVGSSRYREIDQDSCKIITNTDDMQCILEGEIVTYWTGVELGQKLGVAQVEGVDL